MTSAHRFARLVFAAAGFYGLLTVTPLYWMEASIARDTPPGITHPEYYYGFIGVTVAWQLAFLMIARDPARCRPFMPLAILEKLAFGVPALLLYAQHRLAGLVFGFGLADLAWGVLFATCHALSHPGRFDASLARVARAAPRA
jgi:hypothetical protein